ncbi:hypothetical protein EZ428_22200 [Pedobacter frigiditerrae]|uniref:ABC-2 family transporter protein n=1 Tax=Pedobacter frigiditerrae TaxID=2530452 RepID=A0A4R0MJY9_9SPHI|nr:hypothetical protein [Pedobacter frigiditerrae]TCC86920.1 hypothetical protein EZ428_22200 [Pedobacter frigiditerrae]
MQFSFTRFNHLFIKQWKENKKAYLLGLIALPILIGVISLIMAYSTDFSENNQNTVLVFGLLIIGGIFCSTLLGDYAPKPRAIRSLILPTTNLEKLLVAIVYGLIIFPIVYLVIVSPVILLVNYIDFEIFGNLYLTATYTYKNFLEFIFGTTSILSFVLLCSLFYRKFIFIKASLTFVCLIFLLIALNSVITNLTFGNSQPSQYSKEFKKSMGSSEITIEKTKLELTSSGPFSTLEFSNGTPNAFRISQDKNIGLLSFILVLLFMPTMLLACFYRLKEIEL